MREQQPKKMTQADREIAVASRNQQPEAAFQSQASLTFDPRGPEHQPAAPFDRPPWLLLLLELPRLRLPSSWPSLTPSVRGVRHPHAASRRAAGACAPPGPATTADRCRTAPCRCVQLPPTKATSPHPRRRSRRPRRQNRRTRAGVLCPVSISLTLSVLFF